MKIVLPHDKISRLVTDQDVERVYNDAEKITGLLNASVGMYKRFYAIAHAQVETEDPLRFFVINPATDLFRSWREIVVINPVMIRHTDLMCSSEEACASFASMPMTSVKRWTKCEVEFSPLQFVQGEDGKNKPVIGRRISINMSGKLAKVFQHEMDHLDAKYIY